MKARKSSLNRWGYSLLEITLGIAVLAILIVLLLGVLSKSRRQATKLTCLTNLHELGAAFKSYQAANNLFMPLAEEGQTIYKKLWVHHLRSYVGSDKVFVCPENEPQPIYSTGIGTPYYRVYDDATQPAQAPHIVPTPGAFAQRDTGSLACQAAKITSKYPVVYFYFERPASELLSTPALWAHRFKLEIIGPDGAQTISDDLLAWARNSPNEIKRAGPYTNVSAADFIFKVSLPGVTSGAGWVFSGPNSDFAYYDTDDLVTKNFPGTKEYPPPSGNPKCTESMWIWNKYMSPWRISQRINHDNDFDYIDATYEVYMSDKPQPGQEGISGDPTGFSEGTWEYQYGIDPITGQPLIVRWGPSRAGAGGEAAALPEISSTNLTPFACSYGYNTGVGSGTEKGIPFRADEVSARSILLLDYGALLAIPNFTTVGNQATIHAPPPNIPKPHVGGKVNILFMDGSVESVKPENIPNPWWSPQGP